MAQQLPKELQPQPKPKAKVKSVATVKIPKTTDESEAYGHMEKYTDRGYAFVKEEKGHYILEAPIEIAKAWEKEAQEEHYRLSRSSTNVSKRDVETVGDSQKYITQESVMEVMKNKADFMASLDNE